jgi:hypothetical protein
VVVVVVVVVVTVVMSVGVGRGWVLQRQRLTETPPWMPSRLAMSGHASLSGRNWCTESSSALSPTCNILLRA